MVLLAVAPNGILYRFIDWAARAWRGLRGWRWRGLSGQPPHHAGCGPLSRETDDLSLPKEPTPT